MPSHLKSFSKEAPPTCHCASGASSWLHSKAKRPPRRLLFWEGVRDSIRYLLSKLVAAAGAERSAGFHGGTAVGAEAACIASGLGKAGQVLTCRRVLEVLKYGLDGIAEVGFCCNVGVVDEFLGLFGKAFSDSAVQHVVEGGTIFVHHVCLLLGGLYSLLCRFSACARAAVGLEVRTLEDANVRCPNLGLHSVCENLKRGNLRLFEETAIDYLDLANTDLIAVGRIIREAFESIVDNGDAVLD